MVAVFSEAEGGGRWAYGFRSSCAPESGYCFLKEIVNFALFKEKF